MKCDNNDDIKELVEKFAEGNIRKEEWHHYEHLVVAVWYLEEYSFEVALEKIKKGILLNNKANGVIQTKNGGYHETLTIFLVKAMANVLNRPELSKLSLINKISYVEEHFGDFKMFILTFYTEEKINSWEARVFWQEPDLKSSDF
jgi:hypothetical protein